MSISQNIVQEGSVVVATAGKEKNKLFVVLKKEEKYVFLVDGKRLKTKKPKKKSLKHVQKASKEIFNVENLTGQEKDNAEIRKFLKERVCQNKMSSNLKEW